MKLKYTILPLALSLMSSLTAQTYDYTWSGTTESDFKWNTATNWTPNGTPSSASSVYIVTTADNGLSGNNINLGGNVSVKDITWESSKDTQKLFTGGTLTAENYTAGILAEGYFQYNFASTLNVAKSDGTGLLNLTSTKSKYGYSSVEYLFNARVTADNVKLGDFNAWSGSLKLAIGWNGGGSLSNPFFNVKNEFYIGTGSNFNSTSATTYTQFGGLTGKGGIATGTKVLNTKLTGSSTYTYDGTVTGSLALTVASTGVQIFTSATSAITSVSMESGELQLAATAGDLSLSGGKISSIANGVSGDTLNATSFGWSGGKLGIDIDADGADKLSVSGNLFTSGTGDLTFSLNFDDVIMDELLEDAVGNSLSYEVVTFTGTSTLDNKNFVFEDDFNKYYYAFNVSGKSGYLTISSKPIPEPASIAGILGIVALAFGFWRRRK